jgi:probable addiction module antidote protein
VRQRCGKRFAKLAREAGMNRQALHKALSEGGNPTLDTVLKVLKALGLQMRIEAAAAA